MALTVARTQIAKRGLVRVVLADSAGTHAPSPPQRPDPRAVAALERRGYKPERMRSNRVTASHFANFDLILAMDEQNLAALYKLCPGEHSHKLRLLLRDAPGATRTEVPDPYFGNAQGFELALDLCETGVDALLKQYSA